MTSRGRPGLPDGGFDAAVKPEPVRGRGAGVARPLRRSSSGWLRRPLPFAAVLRAAASGGRPAWLVLVAGASLVFAAAALTWLCQRPELELRVNLGPFAPHVHPGFATATGVLLTLWLGWGWAAIATAGATFWLALQHGESLQMGALTGLGVPLTLGVYALAYQGLPLRLDLRTPASVLTYAAVSLVAITAGSASNLVWHDMAELAALPAVSAWLGSWLAGLAEAAQAGLLLALLTPAAEGWKRRHFPQPERVPLSEQQVLWALAAVSTALAALTLAHATLGRSEIDRLASALSGDERAPLAGIGREWQLMAAVVAVWMLFSAAVFGGVARIWHAALRREVGRRTDELRESELRFQGIFNQSTSGILILDPAARVVDANDPILRYTGYSRDEVSGRPIFELAWFAPPSRETFARVLAGEMVRDEVPYLQRKGRRRQIERSFSPVRNAGGEVVFVLAEGRDVTSKRSAERRLEESVRHMERLSQRLLSAQEEERRAIARELHDEVGQTLMAIKLNLHSASAHPDRERLTAETMSLLDLSLRQIRDLSLLLRPPLLEELGLPAALRGYAEPQCRRAGLDCAFRFEESGAQAPPEVEITAFRIAQEALGNVIRHARASCVFIGLAQESGTLVLSVEDDGAGFDVHARMGDSVRGETFGLLGMRERVQLIGGSLSIDSTAGKGTRVVARFPLRRAQALLAS